MRERILTFQRFIYKHRLLWAMLVLGLMFCMRRTTPYVVADVFEDISDETHLVSETDSLKSDITFSSSKLYGIELAVSHYDENADSASNANTKVELFDQDDLLVQTFLPNALNTENYIEGEKYIRIFFDEVIEVDPRKSYSLVLSTDASLEEGLIFADDIHGNLWTRPSYLLLTFGQRFLLSLAAISIVIILTYWMILSFLKEKDSIRPEKVYLFLALALGVLYLFILPIFKVPDSVNHYVRSYEITKGLFVLPNGGVVDIPRNLIPCKDHTYTYSGYAMVHHNVGMIDMADTIKHDAVNMALYSPLSYILQSVGILLGGLFSNNTYILYYAGCVFNLLGTTAIVYFAIRLIPYGKWILTAISLLPMILQQKSSLSVDALTYAMIVATISFVVYWRNSKDKMSGRDIALMYAILLLLGSCKIVYFIVGMAFLMIPNERFSEKSHAMLHKIVSMLVLLGTSVGWILFASNYLGNTRGGADASSKLHIILKTPWRYLYIMNKVLWEDGEQYFLQLLGNQLGSTDVYVSGLLFIAVLVILLKVYYEEKRRKIRNDVQLSAFLMAICLGVGVLVFTSLYIQWTDPVAATYTIEGIQGRYLLPVAPILTIGLLSGSDAKEKMNNVVCCKSIYIIGCVNVIALLVIWGATSYLG